jgi:hypothetical protein
MKKKLQALPILGAFIVIAGSLGHFMKWSPSKYIFGLGSLMIILYQLLEVMSYDKDDFRIKRILRMNLTMSLLLGLATYSMFDGTNLWIVALLIYALVSLFLTFRR